MRAEVYLESLFRHIWFVEVHKEKGKLHVESGVPHVKTVEVHVETRMVHVRVRKDHEANFESGVLALFASAKSIHSFLLNFDSGETLIEGFYVEEEKLNVESLICHVKIAKVHIENEKVHVRMKKLLAATFNYSY